MSGPQFRPVVLAAREELAEGREKLRRQHTSGSPGFQVCALLTDLLDAVIRKLYQAALEDLREPGLAARVSLVAHGGYGRRDVAPFSDVDLMLLHDSAAADGVAPLAQQLIQNVVDSGLQLGFSVRTPLDACRLARRDPKILTSLIESRSLDGDAKVFTRFVTQFRRDTLRQGRGLVATIEQARRAERRRFGETVYMLKPNIKRSRGGLRDLQLVRWVGFARYGEADPESLMRAGLLSRDDFRAMRAAHEFLLQLRNEMHFHAGRSQDLLDRTQQVRLAERYGFRGQEGLLPVEEFMRSYFEHTSHVRYAVSHFMATARPRSRVDQVLTPLFSHQVERDFRVGPMHISATRRGLAKVSSDPVEVLRLMDLANLYNKRIDHATWQAIRSAMMSRPSVPLEQEAIERFLSLLSQPARLGALLRRLHELRVLEQIIPPIKHARCLLQFNDYHKYTVDEHSLRAIEWATGLMDDDRPVGMAYRDIKQKRTLHLALLLHDLGKGFPEDHSEVGLRIAAEVAKRLRLPAAESHTLQFLVHKHLIMAHLAFRHDLHDEAFIVKFASEVGSPEVLQTLYVLTCADLAAVGPGVLTSWKQELLDQLYRRTRRHITDDPAANRPDASVARRRSEVQALLASQRDDAWWDQQIPLLPRSYLFENSPRQIVDALRQLRNLLPGEAVAWARYLADRHVTEYTVGACERSPLGIFHRLTGALTSRGCQILSAEICSLADRIVLDRFYVQDTDFQDEPPQSRLDDVCAALVQAISGSSDVVPSFRRIWSDSGGVAASDLQPLPTRIRFDNNTAEKNTIVTVFAYDRMGLLYTIARTLYELRLVVQMAKIGTYLDQVVDVFYITDADGQKIEDDGALDQIRQRMMDAIQGMDKRGVAVS